jgi:hypothetical protein
MDEGGDVMSVIGSAAPHVWSRHGVGWWAEKRDAIEVEEESAVITVS